MAQLWLYLGDAGVTGQQLAKRGKDSGLDKYFCISAATILVLASNSAWGLPEKRTNKMISAARELLGIPFEMGGRMRQPDEGIDCQGVLFYAAERICPCGWKSFSTKPTQSVKWRELGAPVAGMAPVAVADLDIEQLRPGDIILLVDHAENVREPAIGVLDDRPVWVWHTGIYVGAGKWINADAVVEEVSLKAYFDRYPEAFAGVFVTRIKKRPLPRRCRKHRRMKIQAVPAKSTETPGRRLFDKK